MPLYGERGSVRGREKEIRAKSIERAEQSRVFILCVWGQRGSKEREGFILISTIFAILSSHLKSDKLSSFSSPNHICVFSRQRFLFESFELAETLEINALINVPPASLCLVCIWTLKRVEENVLCILEKC